MSWLFSGLGRLASGAAEAVGETILRGVEAIGEQFGFAEPQPQPEPAHEPIIQVAVRNINTGLAAMRVPVLAEAIRDTGRSVVERVGSIIRPTERVTPMVIRPTGLNEMARPRRLPIARSRELPITPVPARERVIKRRRPAPILQRKPEPLDDPREVARLVVEMMQNPSINEIGPFVGLDGRILAAELYRLMQEAMLFDVEGIFMEVDNTLYPVNYYTNRFLAQALNRIVVEQLPGSGAELEALWRDLDAPIIFTRLGVGELKAPDVNDDRKVTHYKRKYTRKGGRFFKYNLNINIDYVNFDFRDLQIFNKAQLKLGDDATEAEKQRLSAHCLIWSIHYQSKIPISHIEEVYSTYIMSMNSEETDGRRLIPCDKRWVKIIAEKLELTITLTTIRTDNLKSRKEIINDGYTHIELGLYDDHYFPMITFPYSKFFLNNIDKVMEIAGEQMIMEKLDIEDIDKVFRTAKVVTRRYMQYLDTSNQNLSVSSIDVVKWLIQNKERFLIPADMSKAPTFTLANEDKMLNTLKSLKSVRVDSKKVIDNTFAMPDKVITLDGQKPKNIDHLKYIKVKDIDFVGKPWVYETDKCILYDGSTCDVAPIDNYKYLEVEELSNDKYKLRKAIDLIHADFETIITEGAHKPYMLCRDESQCVSGYIVDESTGISRPKIRSLGKAMCYEGSDCVTAFLEDLDSSVVNMIVFHNRNYDMACIIPHIYVTKSIGSGSGTKDISGYYNRLDGKCTFINLKCSYQLIPMKLAAFSKTFDLGIECDKLDSAYHLYNSENIQKEYVSLDEVKESFRIRLSDGSYKLYMNKYNEFIDGVQDFIFEKDGVQYFRHMAQSKHYCMRDVAILRNGFMKFREWILETAGCDILFKLTATSISKSMIMANGDLNGVHSSSGIIRAYIKHACPGGRTMIRNNKKFRLNESNRKYTSILLDACSLYPSAMSLIRVAKGEPKILKEYMCNWDFINSRKCDDYVVTIKITRVGKAMSLPIINSVNTDGSRMFHNNCCTTTVCKITLEDMIRFQHIEFEVLGGIYYNEGYNLGLNNTMKNLYQTRLQHKDNKNPIETVFKLMMNSGYGFFGLNPIDDDQIFVDKKDLARVVGNQVFDNIKHITNLSNGQYILNVRGNVSGHHNFQHISANILAMSKRIMAELTETIDDMEMAGVDIQVTYTDTDSIHIRVPAVTDSVDTYKYNWEHKNDPGFVCKLKGIETSPEFIALQAKFLELHGKVLFGKQMCQFSNDNKPPAQYTNKKGKCPEWTDSIIMNALYCGKKSYVHECQVINIDTGKPVIYYVTKLKGVPEYAIKAAAENYMNGIWGVYLDLYNGVPVDFDLLDGRSKFRLTHNLKYVNRDSFKRVLTFVDKELPLVDPGIFGEERNECEVSEW